MGRTVFSTLARCFQGRELRLRRRDFLKLSAVALMAPKVRAARKTRVVIVGAGLAGLACAYQLKRNGFDPLILEARVRVGGRVLSFFDFVPGSVIEGGGELIGANHPLWNSYAQQFGLNLVELPEPELPQRLFFHGQQVHSAEQLYVEMKQVLDSLLPLAKTIDPIRPWQSPQAVRLDQQDLQQWLDSQVISPLCRRLLQSDFECNQVAPLRQQSLLGLLTAIRGGGLESYFTDSETHRCQSGNQSLAHALAHDLQIRFNCPLQALQADDQQVRLKLSDGSTLQADHVVLAVPPTSWSKISINPPLPPQLRPQMGPALKFLCSLSTSPSLSPDTFSDDALPYTWNGILPQAPGHALIGFCGGPQAQVQAPDYLQILEARFPGLTQEVVQSRLMNWSTDPWCGAGYSCAAPGQICQQGPILDQPLHQRIHIAGEHTCYAFPGFMEGALQSGHKVAARLSQC